MTKNNSKKDLGKRRRGRPTNEEKEREEARKAKVHKVKVLGAWQTPGPRNGYWHRERYKPDRFKHYLTIGELAEFVERSPWWIRQLEKRGSILAPARVQMGKEARRLYSPEQAEEIKRYFAAHPRGWHRKKENNYGKK